MGGAQAAALIPRHEMRECYAVIRWHKEYKSLGSGTEGGADSGGEDDLELQGEENENPSAAGMCRGDWCSEKNNDKKTNTISKRQKRRTELWRESRTNMADEVGVQAWKTRRAC